MNILIITTYYPPDTDISAVRPYMLAKYLTRLGHQVTVLRSGEIRASASDFFDMSIPVRVITYLGPDSPAERYTRGEIKEVPFVESRSRIGFLPEGIRKPISAVYNACMNPVRFVQQQKMIAGKVEKMKAVLDTLRDEHFDVVFATVGQQENIEGGRYAAELFGCKLIQDFRDALATQAIYRGWQYRYLKRIQDEAIVRADGVTAVSEGLRQELIAGIDDPCSNVTIYNGFEPTENTGKKGPTEPGIFSLCYTGVLYGNLRDFTPLLRALKRLETEGRVDLNKIKLHYAGREYAVLQSAAQGMGLESILVPHGYVSRGEAERIQNSADVFLVLSWNYKDSQGILTGKFYEGIRAQKPIVSLVNGNLPNSELHILNEKYQYGFCYESCREKEQFDDLCDYLAKAYEQKMQQGSVQYEIDRELKVKFRYDNIAQQLEDFIQTIR